MTGAEQPPRVVAIAGVAGGLGPHVARRFADVEDPRPYIDLVLPDEFPLSIFYSSLRVKLAPVLRREPVAA